MNSDEHYYEEEIVTFQIERERPCAELWKILSDLGFSRVDDVFLMPRTEPTCPAWQHDAYAEVEILRNGREIYGRSGAWDAINLAYPLARVPEKGIELFVETVRRVSDLLGVLPSYRARVISPDELDRLLHLAADDLKQKLAAAGSEDVAIFIESRYGGPNTNE